MTRELPTITVVTPSYNQGSFIRATIESVLGQGYPHLEYIVMDGGSTDETVDILREYEGRVPWVSEKDRGQSDAINKGFRQASGDIIAFLNSDDLYEPGALLAVGNHFASRPATTWLTGKCRIVDTLGHEKRRSITAYKNFWLRTHTHSALVVLNYISQPATFWRRSVIDEIGELDENLHYTMDYDYWLRLWKRWPLQFVNRYLADFRVHPASKGGTSAARQFQEGLDTARRHVRSPLLLALHRAHAAITVASYKQLATPRRAST